MPAICSPLTSWRQTPAAGRGCCVNLSNLAEFSAWVEQVATLADPIHFAVVDQQRGKAVGSLALMRIDIAHGVVEVGHVHFHRY